MSCIWPRIGPGRAVSLDCSSGECMTLASEWLTSCLEKHPICKPPASTPLPTRVIDVGDSNAEARLCVTKGESAKDADLSHCWGSRIPVSTTAATPEDRLESIQFDASSRTFAEAVNLTRRLGIRCLWIDSLCIIQKSEDDWATEAGGMSGVFQNATITLSANAARDASEGLFGDKSLYQQMQQVQQMEISGPDGQPITIHIRLRATHPSDSDRASHASFVCEDTKLSTRAWVVQERLLSPRMLHFFHEEMSWSCSSCIRCECRLQTGSSSSGVFRSRSTRGDPAATHPQSCSRVTKDCHASHRQRIILYHESASCGFWVGGPHAQRTSRRYFARLWSFDIDYQMLWFSDHCKAGSDRIRRHSNYKSPEASWYWASVTGPVRYFDRHQDQFQRHSGESEIDPLLKVTDGWTEAAGPNAYGPAKTGIATVAGQILPIVYDITRSVWRPNVKPYDQEDPAAEPEVTFDVLTESPSLSEGMSSLNYVFLRAAT